MTVEVRRSFNHIHCNYLFYCNLQQIAGLELKCFAEVWRIQKNILCNPFLATICHLPLPDGGRSCSGLSCATSKGRTPNFPPQDLLFVHESRERLDPVVELTNTLQYRFLRDGKRTPMTVRETEMERFKKAVEATVNHYYYTPKEVVPDMIGKRVRIVGGPLDGYEGNLQKMQGSRSKRLFVELPDLLTVAVEVQPEFIQIIK